MSVAPPGAEARTDSPKAGRRISIGWLLIGLILAILCLIIGLVFPFQIPFVLALGWVWFAADRAAGIQVSPESIAIGMACLLLVAVVGDRFARWLHGAWRGGSAEGGARVWKRRWTAAGLALFVLLFASIISTAAIVHQLLWLGRGPLVESDFHRGRQKRTMSDLRALGTAVEAYRVDNGHLPPVGDGTVDSLAPFLNPTYLNDLPLLDGWKGPLFWRHWPGSDAYRLVSLGKDGRADETVLPGATTAYAADIYFGDGGFIVYPEGTQR